MIDTGGFYSTPAYHPPCVDFEMRAVEDREATIRDGVTRYKDVPFAIVSPIGDAKNVVERPAEEWLAGLGQSLCRDMPPEIIDRFRQGYKRWLAGEALPVEGTPISVGGLFSPAEQKTLLEIHVKTIEQLADLTEEGIRQLGLGGRELKAKARKYLQNLQLPKAKVNAEIESLKVAIENLKAENERLLKLVAQKTTHVDLD